MICPRFAQPFRIAPANALAALLGHSKIQMVLRYAHPQAEHKAQAIRKMEEFQAARQLEEARVSELVQ
jgi:hypothetical protein